MDEYNIYGWTALHEACYKGYTNAVTRFLDYAKETGKNLIEQRTVDDYKTTPIIIAALGGHLEVIDLLVKNGADINAELNFQNSKHGIIEIAGIRQHIELLVYFYELIPEIPKRIKDLMICKNFDRDTRSSVGRTIETLSKEYSNIMKKLSKFKSETHDSKLKYLFDTEKIITYKLITQPDFGLCLATFLKLNENNEDAIASCMLILLNVIESDEIRKQFLENKGVFYIVSYMENHKKKLKQTVEAIINLLNKMNRKPLNSWEHDDDEFAEPIHNFKEYLLGENSENSEAESKKSTWVECASIGQALNALCKYEDCLEYINKDGFNEKIISYLKILFDFNNFTRYLELVNSDETSLYKDFISDILSQNSDSIIFEQYIGPYLSCLGNLANENQLNKKLVLNFNLFELILNFWKQIQLITSTKVSTYAKKKNETFKIYYFSTDASLLSFKDYNLEQSSFFKNQKSISNEDTESVINSILFKEETTSSKVESINKTLENITPLLAKNLKLTIIECTGKILRFNNELKKKYILPSDIFYFTRSVDHLDLDGDPWVLSTIKFIKSLISYLEAITYIEKEYQLEVLRFIRSITDDDPIMQNRLVNIRTAFNSSLINNFRNFLRKSSHNSIRSSALFCLWSLTGDKNYQDCFDRKCILYRAVGVQKFVDTLFETDDELILICLEAITCISNSPPYRENDTNKLIYVQDDVAQAHAALAVVRILKSNNPKVLFSCLKTLSSMCVSIGYFTCFRNQSQIEKVGGIPLVIDIAFKKSWPNRLRCEAFKSLAMISLNNSNNRRVLNKLLGSRIDDLVRDVVFFLTKPEMKSEYESEKDELEHEIEILNTQITAGLAICGFSYRNDDFFRRIIMNVGRIRWSVFLKILKNLNICFDKSTELNNRDVHFECERLQCLFGFLISSLHNLIVDADEDPRAIGLQVMVDTIPVSKNSYLRSIACDYIGRLIIFNDCLIESLLSIGVIENLAISTIGSDSYEVTGIERQEVANTERGCAAITLGIFTNLNPESRRILLRFSRDQPKVMESLKYFNHTVHIDLITQWNHFKELDESAKKEIKFLSGSHRNRKQTE